MEKGIFWAAGVAILLLIGVNFAPAPVDSVNNSVTVNINGQQIGQVCSILGDKIDNRIAAYGLKKEKHQAAYNNLKNRLISLNEKLMARGYDTADLKADLVVLDQKITQFASDYQIYVDKLNETKSYTCGQSKGQYRLALKNARAALVTLRQDALAIRDYFLNTIKPDLMVIRAQKVKIGNGNASSTDEGND